MRPLWQGALNFGLVNIPVRLYSATNEIGLDLDMLHSNDHSPIRYARICKKEEREIPYQEIVKGFEISKGNYVVLDKKEFEAADLKKTRSISIEEFIEPKEIELIYFEKSYYLEPDKGAEKPYALLRQAMAKAGKVGLATFVMKNREHLGVVNARDHVLVFTQMRFHEEVRPTKELEVPNGVRISDKELAMAERLVDELSNSFDIKKYKDVYTAELREIIAKKAKGKVVKVTEKEPELTPARDLMAALKASLEKQTVSSRK